MVKQVQSRTEDPAGESRTGGGGPGAVESLDALGAEATRLQSAEVEERQAVVVAQEQSEERKVQAAQDAAAQEVAAMLGMLRDLAAPMVEDAGYLKPGQTAAIWTDGHMLKISGPLLAVLDRHGMDLSDLMEKAGPYVMLAAGLLLPGVATLKAVRENKAARAVEPAEPAADGQ
jgi:hypothetical protein